MRAIIALFLLLALGSTARATELPQNESSPDNAALMQKLQEHGPLSLDRVQGFVHVQDQKARVLIQPVGRVFRDIHSTWQFWIDAAMIVVAVGAMGAMYLFLGSMRVSPDPYGRTIQRFTGFERFIHWLVAFCFIALGLSGLNMVFGRTLLAPVMGEFAFAEMAHLAKLSHDFLAFPFTLGLAVLTVQWLLPNIPDRTDITWIKMAGGMLGGDHPPAWKFNAGQKMIYWAAVGGGGALVLTGAGLLFPFYVTNILGMQLIQVAHSMIAAVMMAIIIGHIYLGTIGVRGSFDAMASGRVDLHWAQEHHRLWVQDEAARGRLAPEKMYPAE